MDTQEHGAAGPVAGHPTHDDQHDIPPSYETVVADQRAETSKPEDGSPNRFPYASIVVVDPVKQGDGVNAYISYKVVTKTREVDGPGASGASGASTTPQDGSEDTLREWTVIRRFRDFFWVRQSLQKQYAGVILPPLPARNVVEKYKMAPEFIEDRRRALERFLVKVSEHTTLNQSPALRLFLTASESEFNIESARMSYALGAAAPAESSGASGLAASALNTASKLWKNLTDNAGYVMHAPQALSGSNVVQQHVRNEETPEYAAMRQYYNHLEAHLNELHSQAQRLTKQHERFGSALAEFGAALNSLSLGIHSARQAGGDVGHGAISRPLGDNDAGTHVDAEVDNEDQCASLGKKARVAGQGWVSVSEELHANFEQPLRELLRAVQSAKKTIEDRDEALLNKIQSQMNVDAKRGMVAKLQATPGTRQDRIMAEERGLQQAVEKSETATRFYDELVQRMDADILRFQKERQADLHKVLVAFGEILANHSGSSWE